ncbi:MAG: hypothetical protein IT290_03335 [Deltaproteobacteria bacterium]|nr:hypothetical protein [Deltaproteobacteria bacterium]
MAQGLSALAGIRYVLNEAVEKPDFDEHRARFLSRSSIDPSEVAVEVTLESTRNGKLVGDGGAHDLKWYLKSPLFRGLSFVFTPYDYRTNFLLKSAISESPELAARCKGVRINHVGILESHLDPRNSLTDDQGMHSFIAEYGIVPAVVSQALRSTSNDDPPRALSFNIGRASPVTFANWALALRPGDVALCVFELEWSGQSPQYDFLSDYVGILLNPTRRSRVVLWGEPHQFKIFEMMRSERARESA